VREECQNHVLKPVNVNLTLLHSKEAFFGLLSDLLSRLEALRQVVHVLQYDVLLTDSERLVFSFRVSGAGDGVFMVNDHWGSLCRLNRSHERIAHGRKGSLRQHAPSRGLFASWSERAAANFAELTQTDHIVDSAVTLNIDCNGDTIVRSRDLGDGNFTILHILALVDTGLVFTVQVAKIDTPID